MNDQSFLMQYRKHEIMKRRNIYFMLFIFTLCLLIVIQYYRGHDEKIADTDNPVMYEKKDIRFLYPGNWKITEDKEDTEGGFSHHVFIESPGNATFIIQIFPNLDTIPLQQFAEQFSKLTQQKGYPRINNSVFSELEESINSTNNYSIQENFSLKVGGQSPHIRRYYSITNNKRIVYLISQTAKEDLPKVNAGFALILASFNLTK